MYRLRGDLQRGGLPMKRALLLSLALAARLTWAASWAVEGPAIEQLLPVPGQVVIVVAAGEPVVESREAARAVELAVQNSGRAKLVMNEAALGSFAFATDEEVRRKAASVPHEVLIIVRVFMQGTERTPIAMVIASEPGAEAKRSLTLQRRVAPVPPPSSAPLASGPLPSPAPPVRDAREEAYEAQRLHFGQKGLIAGRSTASLVYQEPAYEGARRLTTEQLFEQLGRKDFLEASRARGALRLGLGLAAGGVGLVGAGLVLVQPLSPCFRVLNTSDGECLGRAAPSLLVPGLITLGVAAGLGLTALILPAHPASREEVGKSVDESNAKLRRSLGFTSLELVPQLGAQGGGLTLAGRF